jgi:hypothetical protein
MKVGNSGQLFEKYSNIKFYANPSCGSRVVPFGPTDRRDEDISRFSQFANAPKSDLYRAALLRSHPDLLAENNVSEIMYIPCVAA